MEASIQYYLHDSNNFRNAPSMQQLQCNALLCVLARSYLGVTRASLMAAIERAQQHQPVVRFLDQVAHEFALPNAVVVDDFNTLVDGCFIQAAPSLTAKCEEIMHGLLTDANAPIKYSDRRLNWAVDLLEDLWPLPLSLVPVGAHHVIKHLDFVFGPYLQMYTNSRCLPSVLYAWFDELCMEWMQALPTPLSANFEMLYDTLRAHHYPDPHEWYLHDDYCVIKFQEFSTMSCIHWELLFHHSTCSLGVFNEEWMSMFSRAKSTRMKWKNPKLLHGLRRLLLHGIALEVSMSWPSIWQCLCTMITMALSSTTVPMFTGCEQLWNDWLLQCTTLEKQFMRLWLVQWLHIESDRIHRIVERYLPQFNLVQVIAAISNLASGMNVPRELWNVMQQLRQQQRADRLKRGESEQLLPSFQKPPSDL